jgi:hypothetical protein
MLKRAVSMTGLSGVLALVACSGAEGTDDEDMGATDQSIVRPTSTGGRDQAVMIYVTMFDGETGNTFARTCSGSYFAPRVVLTAAHCVDADAERFESVSQVLVYHGDDFASDVEQLTPTGAGYQVAPPGQPSTFAAADSYEQHPDWDRELIHPDLAVVYLDRELPFEPLPLARFRLDRSWLWEEVKISGWGDNVATDPTSGTGSLVQRTGRTRLLGSPTAADYHPEDPNPGMLVPAVRANVIKTDGRAPYSNACFGDSGGPILARHWGRTYIAGVEYFGGLFCEDYSLYTRIDPFLPFLDRAAHKGGNARVVPKFDCVAENADGTLTAFFGYNNHNGVSVTVPFGRDNFMPRDELRSRPTHFLPGRHEFVFGADFRPWQTLVYRLSPDSGPTTTLTVNRHSQRCDADDQPQAICGQSCRGQLLSGCEGLPSYTACIDGCTGFYEIFADFPQCYSHMDAWNACQAATPPGPEQWMCFPESSPGAGDGVADAPECTPFIDEFFACLGG